MNPLESLARLTELSGRNLAYNLEFIPSDKLAWKPAPEAKSVLEIVHHLTGALTSIRPILSGGSYTPFTGEEPGDCASAQTMVRAASRDYAAALQEVDLGRLGEQIQLPFGTFPLGQLLTFPVFDVMHHHGQIAYIQTLLGDTQDHFDL